MQVESAVMDVMVAEAVVQVQGLRVMWRFAGLGQGKSVRKKGPRDPRG
jgi:hypothetical protein